PRAELTETQAQAALDLQGQIAQLEGVQSDELADDRALLVHQDERGVRTNLELRMNGAGRGGVAMAAHQDRVLDRLRLLLDFADFSSTLLRQSPLVSNADDFQSRPPEFPLKGVQVPDRRTARWTFRMPEVEQHQAALA